MEEKSVEKLVETFKALDPLEFEEEPYKRGWNKDTAQDKFAVLARKLENELKREGKLTPKFEHKPWTAPCIEGKDPKWAAVCLLFFISRLKDDKTSVVYWSLQGTAESVQALCGGLVRITKSNMNWSWRVSWSR